MNLAHNIYIHTPFCMSKCNYCAFFSQACAKPDWEKYEKGIIAEIDSWAGILGQISVPTIFFGGGTPSLIPTSVFGRIMSHLRKNFNLPHDCEITLESNPGTLDAPRLDEFISAGVNRLSVGVQSFDDARLKFLGRRHDADTARRLLGNAMARNIRVSADFIYGMPGDGVDDVVRMCNEINKIGLTHVSLYELTIEPGTPFYKMNLDMPSNSDMADMYNAIDDTLYLNRYEVSNYAVPGNECRHNQNVWDGEPYIGIGPGAAGRIFINDTWYEQMGANERFDSMPDDARAMEQVITGMRTVRGVKITPAIKKIINHTFIDNNPELITQTGNGRIATTKKGILILDEILIDLVK